jgi:hypothetical protein
LSDFEDLCTGLIKYDEIIILGDFNLLSFQENGRLTSATPSLSSVAAQFDLLQHVTSPTHEKGRTIDLIFTRSSSKLVHSVAVGQGLSDHSSVHFKLSMTSLLNNDQRCSKRSYGAISLSTFNEDIQCYACQPVFSHIIDATNSPNQQATPSWSSSSLINVITVKFDNSLRSILDSHAPLKETKVRCRNTLPWWTPEIRILRKSVRKAESHWRKSRLEVDRLIYAAQRNSFHNQLVLAKRNYLCSTLEKHSCDSKKLWKQLNAITGRKLTSVLPDHSSASALAIQFNTFFLKKVDALRFGLLNSSQPSSKTDRNQSVSSIEISTPLYNFSLASEKEVEKIILRSPKKTSSLDALPHWLMLESLPVLLPAITSIVNRSLTDGMPQLYKLAIVTPLIKKRGAAQNEMSNYRPVSNLSFLSKVIERVVLTRLLQHIETNCLADPQQSAYRKHHSCESTLLCIQDHILRSFDIGEVTALVLLDMSAAFDTVDHTILITRLREMGIMSDALSWIDGYLNDRQQCVMVNGVQSTPQRTVCGVPQGSVLGPVLFTLYISPLSSIIRRHTLSYKFYADDLQIYISCPPSDVSLAVQQLEECLVEVQCWLTANMLCLNAAKSEFCLFGTRHQLQKCPDVSVTIGCVKLNSKSPVRNLGVMIDDKMTLSYQIQSVSKVSYAYLRIISRIRNDITTHHCKLLVDSLVSSRIEFCASLYYGISDSLINKLQKVENASYRLVMRLPKYCSVSSELKKSGWLSVKQKVQKRVLFITYEALHGRSPSYISCLLAHQPALSRNLRSTSKDLLLVPWVKTESGKKSFSVCASRLWNDLPHEIRASTTPLIFLSELNTFLLNACVPY